MERTGLNPEDLAERPGPTADQAYRSQPRYQLLPVTPSPIIVNSLVVAWDIPVTMLKGDTIHTVSERYECAHDEMRPVNDPENSRILERALMMFANERGLWDRCADELEAIIANQTGE